MEDMVHYRREMRKTTKTWCEMIDQDAECFEDLAKEELSYKELVNKYDCTESGDSAEFDDLVNDLKHFAVKRALDVAVKSQGSITDRVTACKKLIQAWTDQPEFRLFEYRFLEMPEFWDRWLSGQEALKFLQDFSESVYAELENTRTTFVRLLSNFTPPDSEVLNSACRATFSPANEDIEKFCSRTIHQEYERQESTRNEEPLQPPQVEHIYLTLIAKLAWEFNQHFKKLEQLSGELAHVSSHGTLQSGVKWKGED